MWLNGKRNSKSSAGTGRRLPLSIVFHNLARSPESRPLQPDLLPRQIPASTNIPPPLPPPPDPWAGVRKGLWPLTFVVGLGVFLVLAVWLLSANGGKLINKDLNKSSEVPWCPFRRPWGSSRHPVVRVKAAHHGTGFCLSPLRPGLEEPLIAQVRLANPFAWGPWEVQLTTLEGYEIRRQEEGIWSPRVTLGARDQVVEVKDGAGIVARGTLRFEPENRVQKGWKSLIVVGVLGVMWLIATPFFLAALPVPPTPVVVPPQPELLCD